MVGKKNFDENTGTGISTVFCDGERNLLVVHCDDSKVLELDSVEKLDARVKNEWTFQQFIAADFTNN